MPRTLAGTDLRFFTSSYLGNGQDDRRIECGFSPDLVIITGTSSSHAVFRTSAHSGDDTSYIRNAVANLANAIQSFFSKGFTIGTDSTVNSSGVIYHYAAFKKGNSLDFEVFTYTGTGVTNNITLPFQPDAVFIKKNSTTSMRCKFVGDASNVTHSLVNGPDETDAITTLNSGGFTVTANTSVNASASTYYGFAFKISNTVKIGTYVGDGIDDRVLTGFGIAPNFAFVRNHTNPSTTAARARWDTFIGDLTTTLTNAAFAADAIQGLTADGINVGTSINANESGSTHHYLAIKKGYSRIIVV